MVSDGFDLFDADGESEDIELSNDVTPIKDDDYDDDNEDGRKRLRNGGEARIVFLGQLDSGVSALVATNCAAFLFRE